jgi:heme exporter protein C
VSLSRPEDRIAAGPGSGEIVQTAAPSRWALLVSPAALFAGAGVLLAAGFLLAFWYAPTDSSTMGFSQKVFYFHAPIAETALVAFAVAFVAGVLYLRRQDPKYDRLGAAAVRLGLLFSVLVMATGMIWGKAAWGTWWAWEPRLTTFLIACVLYGAYFVVRWAVEEEQRRAAFAAVFAIVAFVDVPITFFATRYLPAGLHPVLFTSSGSGMAASMLVAFLVSMAGMTLLLAAMLRLELQLAALKSQVEELKDLLEGERE